MRLGVLPLILLLALLVAGLVTRIVQAMKGKPKTESTEEHAVPLTESGASQPRLQRQKGLDSKDTELWVTFLSHSLAYRKAIEYSGMKPCDLLSNTHGEVWQLSVEGKIVTICHKKNPGNEEGWLLATCSDMELVTTDFLTGKGYVAVLDSKLHKQTVNAIKAKKVCY